MKSKLSLLTILILTFGFSNKALSQNFGEILSVGSEDASTYLENYLNPAMGSFGNGLSEGWYNTAKAHKSLGFDLTISFNIAGVPDDERMFEFLTSDYQNLELRGDDDNMLPTLVGGSAQSGSELVVPANTTVNYPGGQQVTLEDELLFDVPPGIDLVNDLPISLAGIPTPTANLGIGIYKNTDLKIRWTPEVDVDGYKSKLFGIGIMHDVKQWIPGIKNLPFDLSAFVGTTTLSTEYAIDVDIENNSAQADTRFQGTGVGEFKTTSTTVQGIISKKLLFFTPYAAVGFNAIKTNIDIKGDYTYTVDPTVGSSQTASITDPLGLEFKGNGGARATIGARLKLTILTIHAAYTLQKYNTFTFGVGLAVR